MDHSMMDHSVHKAMGHNMGMNHNMNMTTGGMNKTMGNGMDGMMMMMQMTFYASSEVTLFFKGWKTTNAGEMIGSCIALILIGFLYEGLKVARQVLLLQSGGGGQSVNVYVNPLIDSNGKYSTTDENSANTPLRKRMMSLSHFIQTMLHMLQVFIGYLLMLAFMTYNAWICISVIVGAGLGYFVFGWRSPSVSSSGEHCN